MRKAPAFSLSIRELNLKDERLPEMVFRYWCRNWPEQIPEKWRQRWISHCQQFLTDPDFGPKRTAASILASLPALKESHPEQQKLLSDIGLWIEQQCQRVGVTAAINDSENG